MSDAPGPGEAEGAPPTAGARWETFRRNVDEEPEALERVIAAYSETRGPLAELPEGGRLAGSRILLTGMGSSYNACLVGTWWLRKGGVTAVAEYASEIQAGPAEGPWTLVAVSQSGRSPEVLRAVDRFRSSCSGLVVAVTNRESSPLAAACDVLLPLLAGREGDVAAKSYAASVAVLTLLAGRMLGSPPGLRPPDLAGAIEASSAVLADWPSREDEFCSSILSARSVVCLGSGTGRATAAEGAVILKEASLLPVEAIVTAEFLHAALYMAGPRFTALLVPADPGGWEDAEARSWLLRAGSTVVEIGGVGASSLRFPMPALAAAARPLVEALPMELAAASIWRRHIDEPQSAGQT